LQLTDDVESSTADAVAKYVEGCEAGIRQANARTPEEALEQAANATNATNVFSVQSETGSQTLASIENSCPTCPPNTAPHDLECCGNGDCVNGTCRCYGGLFAKMYAKLFV